jgi:4-hydroxy-tetrahydrodipicolinate synthase
MKLDRYKGTGVALVTPFRSGNIDWQSLDRIIEHCMKGGVDYIVSLGTTGEAINLSGDECRKILDFTIKKIDGKLPLVAGNFGYNYTEGLVRKVNEYNFDGIDAILSSSPAYMKPSQEGIYNHYARIAEISSVPIIMYNVPGRTSSNMSAKTTVRLASDYENIIAIKEASGDLVQATQIIKNKPDQFLVISGDDPTALPFISCGGDGIISVIANALPEHFSKMIRLAMEGKFTEGAQIHRNLIDIHEYLYNEGNPVGIKGALNLLGLCNVDVRTPLSQISERNLQALKIAMKKYLD